MFMQPIAITLRESKPSMHCHITADEHDVCFNEMRLS